MPPTRLPDLFVHSVLQAQTLKVCGKKGTDPLLGAVAAPQIRVPASEKDTRLASFFQENKLSPKAG